jgi:monoamine oxidase
MAAVTDREHKADPGALTRRRFLQGVGTVAGAGAVLATMEALDLVPDARRHTAPFRPPGRSDFALQGRANNTTVLVLGGGIAGLCAAYELEKAGYLCEVLEARDRPGGRCWTVRGGISETDLDGVTQTAGFADGHYMNAGPARIPQHHTTLAYCRELGIPIEPFTNANADAYFFNEAAFGSRGPLTARAIRRRTAKADYFGYVSELLAKAINQHALDADVTAADRDALLEFLTSFGALGPNGRYVGSDRRGYQTPPGAATESGDVAEPYTLSDLLAANFGLYFPFELGWDQAMMMFQPVGGMDRIPHALADALRGTIRYRAQVQQITVADDRVDVIFTGDDGGSLKVSADYCVCTIPPNVLADIPSNLPVAVTSALSSVVPMSTGKIGLQFRRRFWEEDEQIFGGITDTNLDIGTIWYPSHGYLGERGVLIGYYNYFEQSDAYAAMPPEERERRALEQGIKVHGDPYRAEFENSFSVHWTKIRHSEGGWALWEDRSTSPSYRTLLEPVGRLYFAGDHLSYVTAWQHGAFESARHVVTALHDRVLASAGQ